MSAYHQMGFNSRNLVLDDSLDQFSGAILSPVNEDEASARTLVRAARSRRSNIRMVFDPQLYYPNSEREKLRAWSYFPQDVDTADVSSMQWWETIGNNCAAAAERLEVDAVCSPAIVPKTFSDKYYALVNDVANALATRLEKSSISVYQTVLLNLDALSEFSSAMSIASIVTRGKVKAIYLILVSDVEPRRELSDSNALRGMMQLIHALKRNGMEVLVGFCSSDVLLWKAAGATSCATGKFFNLRRFTKSRFEEPKGGGGQLPYWIEEAIFAYCREPDVLRLKEADILTGGAGNPHSQTILDAIQQGEPWLKHSWCHYLFWFANVEARLSNSPDLADTLLKTAEDNWRRLGDDEIGILMEESRNDGSWIRPWRIALREFKKSSATR